MRHEERLVITDCLILESLIQGVWGRGQDCIVFFSAMLRSLSDLSPQPGIRPRPPLRWKCGVQTTGVPGNSLRLHFNKFPGGADAPDQGASTLSTTDLDPLFLDLLHPPILHPFNNMPKSLHSLSSHITDISSIFWSMIFQEITFHVTYKLLVCVYVLVTQSCLTLCDPMDCSSPGSSIRGNLQKRILEWVAMPFSRGSS